MGTGPWKCSVTDSGGSQACETSPQQQVRASLVCPSGRKKWTRMGQRQLCAENRRWLCVLGFSFLLVTLILCLGCSIKESACSAENAGSTPGSGRSPGEGNSLQYSCLFSSLNWFADYVLLKKMLKPIYLRVLVFSTNYIAHHILSFTPTILVITSLQRKIYTCSILLKQHFT